ncbi:hypothetical protein [Pigmentiphaga litoralis]|uniref:hypothetical protein n=1 Tax=Pigmentiphaga litoralis TaxID=516702 RepID=UPI003B430AD5
MSFRNAAIGIAVAVCVAAGATIGLPIINDPARTESQAQAIGAFVSRYMIEMAVVLPGWFSVDVLMSMFNADVLSPANQSMIVRAIGNACQAEVAPDSAAEKEKARILAFLKSAAQDPRDPVAQEAALAYLKAAPADKAISFLRESLSSGILPAREFIRLAHGHLWNLEHAEQERLIKEMIRAELTRAQDDQLPTLGQHLIGLLSSRQGVETLSREGRNILLDYLEDNASQFTTVPDRFYHLAGRPLGQWLEAKAWLSGVRQDELTRHLLDLLLASGDTPETVVMMMASYFADDLIALANAVERERLRTLVLKAPRAVSPDNAAFGQYREDALRRLQAV